MPPRISAAKRRKPLLAAVLAAAAALAVAIGVPALIPEPKAEIHFLPTPSPEPTDPALIAADLLQAADLGGDFSFVLYDSVEDAYLLSHRPDDTHFSMSTSKILIAIGALESGADPARVAEMLTWSDDPIANELWGVVAGPELIEAQVEAMGLQHTTPSPDWGRWGDVLISASDMVRVYEYLLAEVPEDDRAVIVDALKATTEQGSDGYDQTFGLPTAAAGLDWAVKQGWGCCKPDRFLVSTGTIGADHRYIVAIFGAWDETKADDAQSAAEMNELAAAILDRIPE